MAFLDAILTHFTLQPIHVFALLLAIAWGKSMVFISSLLPPASIMLLAGISISQRTTLHLGLVWLAVAIGSLTGSILNYHIGYLMRNAPWIVRLTDRHINKIFYVQNRLQKNSLLVLFSARFLAALRYIVPLVAGMLRFNMIKVYLINLLSSVVWAAMYIGIYASLSFYSL